MAIEKTIILNVEEQDAVESVKKVDKSISDTQDSVKELEGGFDKMTGGLVAGFRQVVSGVKKGIVAMKALKISIAATGVGLLVIAIGALVAAFTATQTGMDKVNTVLKPLIESFKLISDIAIRLGEGLVQMFSGDITKGIDTMSKAVSNLGDQFDEAWQKGKRMDELFKSIRDGNANFIRSNQALIESAAIQLLIAEDTTKALKVRIEAFELSILIEHQRFELRKSNLLEELELLKAGRKEGIANATLEDEIATKFVEISQAKVEAIEREKTAQNQLNALKAGGTEDDTRTPAEISQGVIDRTKDEFDTIDNLHANSIKTRMDASIKSEKELTRLKKQEAKNREEIEAAEKKHALDQAQFLIFAIEQIAGEGTALAKAAGIANVIIDAARAIISTWAGYSSMGPFGVAGAIAQTAAIGIMAVVSIKKIASVKKPTRGGGSESGSPAISNQVPAPQFNIVGTAPENQLANVIQDQQQVPVQAFVVASEVSTQQALDRNKVETASFGN